MNMLFWSVSIVSLFIFVSDFGSFFLIVLLFKFIDKSLFCRDLLKGFMVVKWLYERLSCCKFGSVYRKELMVLKNWFFLRLSIWSRVKFFKFGGRCFVSLFLCNVSRERVLGIVGNVFVKLLLLVLKMERDDMFVREGMVLFSWLLLR